KVLVAERGLLPLGASTKNAGFACFGSVSELADDLANMPENTVWDTVKLRNEGLKKSKKLLGEKNMNYLPLGGFEVFDNKHDFEACADLLNSYNKKMQSVLKLKNVYSIVNKKIDSSGLKGFAYCIKNNF